MSRIPPGSWKRSALASPLVALLIGGVTSCGSLTKTEILYASATRSSIETQGHMRLAVKSVRVNVEGTDKVDTLDPCGGYYLVHKTDLVAFVKAADRLAKSDAAGRLLSEAEAGPVK